MGKSLSFAPPLVVKGEPSDQQSAGDYQKAERFGGVPHQFASGLNANASAFHSRNEDINVS